jgi:hypothetical protein
MRHSAADYAAFHWQELTRHCHLVSRIDVDRYSYQGPSPLVELDSCRGVWKLVGENARHQRRANQRWSLASLVILELNTRHVRWDYRLHEEIDEIRRSEVVENDR